MIFDGLEKLMSDVIGLEKISCTDSLLDMSQLNNPIDNLSGKSNSSSEAFNETLTNVKLDGILGAEIAPKSTGIAPKSLGPTIEPIPGAGGLAKITDIFGNTRVCDPSMVDVFSGLPVIGNENFQGQSIGGSEYHTPDEWKLSRAKELEGMVNTAVDHYKDAKARGDTDEMLKWETEANKYQGILFNHLGISPYTLTPKAPGIS